MTANGTTYTPTVVTIKSTNVAFVTIPAGSYSVSAVYGASGKQTQTIDFRALGDKVYGDPPFTVVATATSGLTVTFTAGGACGISNTW